MTTIVVIGAVAAGTSAASQAKRRNPQAEVILIERGSDVSYGACGLPYNIEDPKRAIDDVVVVSADAFRRERHIDVRTHHEVVSLDTAQRRLRVRDLDRHEEYGLSYDKLVIATGASAVRLPLPGIELEGVFTLRTLSDGDAIKQALAQGGLRRAVIVGAGYIGMEMAEALRGRELEVTVLEKVDQVVPGIEPSLSKLVHDELNRQGVRVETGVGLHNIARDETGLVVNTDRGPFAADLVLVSVGVRPNVALAKEAGIRIGPTGALAVDAELRTSVPDVYAAGDCAEALQLVTGEATWVPLGTTANKQGKIAGANATGAHERFAGIVGTAAFKIFELEVGRTGLARAELERAALEGKGVDFVVTSSTHATRGHHYPGVKSVTTNLFVERGTGRLLGAQMVGGEGVAGRIDVLATALYAKMTIDDLAALDLAYAPPLAPVWDPLLIAATTALKEAYSSNT